MLAAKAFINMTVPLGLFTGLILEKASIPIHRIQVLNLKECPLKYAL